MDRVEFESDARRDGYALSEGAIAPGRPRDPSVHDFDARLFVLNGTMTMSQGDDIQVYTSGEVCDVKAGTSHVAQCGPEGVQYVVGRRFPARKTAAG